MQAFFYIEKFSVIAALNHKDQAIMNFSLPR